MAHLSLGIISKEKLNDYQIEQKLKPFQSKMRQWTVGGRWSNLIETKSGERTHIAKISDINFNPSEMTVNYLGYIWETVVVEMDDENHGIYPPPPTKEYLIEVFQTKENYIKTESLFSPYALLLPSNEWLESGPMSEYGEAEDTIESKIEFDHKRQKAFDELQDHYLTIIDCPIK